MYTVKLCFLIGALIFAAVIVVWSMRELRKETRKSKQIDMLEQAWALTDDPDEDELDEEFERN